MVMTNNGNSNDGGDEYGDTNDGGDDSVGDGDDFGNDTNFR